MVSYAATRHKNPALQMSKQIDMTVQAAPMIRTKLQSAVLALALVILTSHSSAQAGETGSVAQAREAGSVTNLPLPRFVSMKASEGNVRRGPSLSHRIDWVFKRRDMPLRITAEHGHWRRVEDRDGMGGWVHYSLLSGTRTVLVEQDMLPLHVRPDPNAPVTAALEIGVVARLGDCGTEWCELRSGGYKGWAPKARVWGVSAHEIRE